MTTRLKFEGGKELERKLLELPEKVAKKLASAAVRKAAKPIYDAARAAVPVDMGDLKQSIVMRVDQGYDRKTRSKLPVIRATVEVGAKLGYREAKTSRARYDYQIGSRPDVYGQFVEFGTVDTPAQPFFRPAWDSEGGETFTQRLSAELGPALEREAGQG